MFEWLERELAWLLGRFTEKNVMARFITVMTLGVTVVAVAAMFALFQLIETFHLAAVPDHYPVVVGLPMTVVITVPLVTLVAYVVGRSIQLLAAAKAEFYLLSQKDPLSGLLNRRAFNDAYLQVNQPSSLMVVDADRFKSINDRFGHDAGDQVILAISTALGNAFPAPHVVARLGGEEFGVILRGITDFQSERLANGIRETLERKSVVVDGQPVAVTVSIGLADFVPGSERNDVMRRADAALYLAKKRGRNRVVHNLYGNRGRKADAEAMVGAG